MKVSFIVAVLVCVLLTISRAEAASILYSTTDLGSGYQLETNANGQTYGVANSSGNVVYAFDKSPVTPIDITLHYGTHEGAYELLTMQNGNYQVGYSYDRSPVQPFQYYPTFESLGNGWDTSSGSPVLDLNSHGQVVGTSLFPNTGNFYAAFSTTTGQSHGISAQVVDNLNNYIASIPGVTLTSAFKIDDLGRILAQGSDGNDYLLTPLSLGAAATVPEPTALMTLGLAVSWFSFRWFRRN